LDAAVGISKRVVVGIPAYNEESNIAKTILRAKSHVDRIVVVDDGSTDDTAIIAKSLGVTLLSNQKNMGKGMALKVIFNAARELDADVLVTIDADAQHDPDEIPKVIEPILNGTADVAVGARKTGPRIRRIALRLLDAATAVHDSDGAIVDSQSGFRAYSKRAINVIDFGERGMGVESESLKKALEKNLVIRQVQIQARYGAETDHTLHPILHFSDVASTITKVVLLRRPIRYLGIPAVLLVVVGLYRWFQILDAYNSTRQFAIGNAIVASLVLIVGFFLGIGAIILLAISLAIQERPKE
jgi:glycosyltransferase involved in cell wall biosynthesis